MQALTKVEFFAELPEDLYRQFQEFIGSHKGCDHNTVLECAIALFLAVSGGKDEAQ